MQGITPIAQMTPVTNTQATQGIGQTAKLTPPTANEVNAFEAAKIQSMPEMRAQAPQQPSQMMADISSRLNSISANYAANAPGKVGRAVESSGIGKSAGVQGAGKKESPADQFGEMFNRFQDMQMFTVRANLVSNGASSSTHTFNSLLKGQ